MTVKILLAAALIATVSCNEAVAKTEATQEPNSIEGTWKLLTGTTIEKNDTVVTDYSSGKPFIKIINPTHFAFLGHGLVKGNDSAAFYTSGGGAYELHDSTYTEHSEYCTARGWEGNDFHFTITIKNDTLVQQGIEKIDSLGINRINIEKYVRLK